MLTCYHCGKILFGKKVLGQVGSSIYYFCSEKCRSAVWNKAAFEKSRGLETLIERLQGKELFGYVHLIKSERSKVAEMADLLD